MGVQDVCGSPIFRSRLTTESVQSTALAFQSVDDIHGGDGLPLGVLGVGDGITDNVLKEHFQDTAGLFVDQTRDTLDTTSASETTDGWLGDTLDVITKNFPVALGTSLSKTLSSLSSSRHVVLRVVNTDRTILDCLYRASIYCKNGPMAARLTNVRRLNLRLAYNQAVDLVCKR